MDRPVLVTVIIIALVFLLLCCLCLAAVLVGGALFSWNLQLPPQTEFSWNSELTPTPVVVRPSPQATLPAESTLESEANSNVEVVPLVELDDAQETLKTLSDTIVPINDLYSIAERLEGKEDIPPTLEPPIAPFQLGAKKSFWALDTDTNENFQVPATLRYITDHSYFWIEDGLAYKEKDLRELAETFEQQIYPTNREFFGSEWTPGVDGDEHIFILFARGLGGNVAGYFSSLDSMNPLVQEYSNGHEMFFFNADAVDLSEEFTYGVLAHEFQHMIHWYRDRNETSWLNEGFSDLAMFLNGYTIGGHDYLYAEDPDLQLNDWPNDQSQTAPHYGASFLFLNYFLDRFGEEATQALVANDDNSMDSIDLVLQEMSVTDPLSGAPLSADDFFADWVITNYLNDPDVGDGRYAYNDYPDAPSFSETETLHNCEPRLQTRDVHQYGVDYIRIGCRDNATLKFEGSTQVAVLPADPYSGSYAFWSNKGDESDMTLTRLFDFTEQTGSLTFSYHTWYDIEEDFDYVYLEASLDGESWQIISTPSGTPEDPTGNNYGWGYNGLSGGGPQWIQEEVDLSDYAGKQVYIRFEYITDAAVNGEGFLLDDVSIPQIGYFSDFETDDGGWEADGWVRIQNVLPQSFQLSLIKQGDTTVVEEIPLTADNSAEIPLEFGNGIDEITLVVSGTTRFTRQSAAYRIDFAP
jgi:hypothetical protein